MSGDRARRVLHITAAGVAALFFVVLQVRVVPAVGALAGYLDFRHPEQVGVWLRLALRGRWPWQWLPDASWWLAAQAVWALGLVALALLVRVGIRPRTLRAADIAVHGSARWRRVGEYAATLVRQPVAAPVRAGVVVGSDGRQAWLTDPAKGSPHTLIIGATRSGKSRRVIMPSIWAIGHAGESMVIADPKGELYSMTAGWLRERGYAVVCIDLMRPGRGCRWNPFGAIGGARAGGDIEEASRAAWELAAVMVSDTGVSDPIWPQAEQSLLAALALAVVWEAPPGRRHPATAYRILSELGADGGRRLDAFFAELPTGHPARLAYTTAGLSEARTRSGIYTGTSAHARLWADPGVAWLLAESDHDPAAAGREPVATFLLMPDEAGSRRSVAALYITQMYAALAAAARERGGRLEKPVWFLLDEFGNIGKMPDMAEKLTVSAGRGVRFVLAIQALTQIEAVYGPTAAKTITGNCDSWLYLRTTDIGTARTIAAMAGRYTVRAYSQTAAGRGLERTSIGETAVGRDLLTPDEVLRWPLGEGLLLQAGQHAARLPLMDLSRWPTPFAPAAAVEAAPVGEVATWVPAAKDKGGGAKKTETPKKAEAGREIEAIEGGEKEW